MWGRVGPQIVKVESAMATRSMLSFAAAVAFVLVSVSGAIVDAAEINVLSTGAVNAWLYELGAQSERETAHKLAFTFGIANVMRKQIEAGEPFALAIMP